MILISICIPAYKHVALTYESAVSVLQQDEDVELVILDDFYLVEPTQENLQEIQFLRDFLYSDKRVKLFSNEKLLPIQENWNKVVSLSTGSHVKLIGADDKMMPGSLAKMSNMISARPTIAFHGHLANIIDQSGVVIRQQRPYGENFVNQSITGVAALKGKLRQQVRFKEPACNFYLKSAWESLGGYEAKYRFAFDVHFNIKMMAAYPSLLWNEYLVELRRHQASDGSQLPASLALTDLRGVLDDILEMIGAETTLLDQAASSGFLQYRLIELVVQRIKKYPRDTVNSLINNLSFFVTNPLAYYFMAKLLLSRGFFGDVQQH